MAQWGDPRTIWSLVDLSQYVELLQKGYITVFGQFERGPMWEPIVIAPGGEEDFTRKFGNTVDWTTDPLQCLTALRAGAGLIVIRIGHCATPADRSTLDILAASCLISDRGATATSGSITSAAGPFTLQQALSGRVTGAELGPYLIVLDTNDKLQVRVGVTGAWGENQTVTLTAGTLTAQEICDAINAQTEGINASVADNLVHMEAIVVGNDLDVMAVTHDCYSTLGINEATYPHTVGTDSLLVAIDSGADQPFTLVPAAGEVGQFVLTSAQVAVQLASLAGAVVNGTSGTVTITSSTTGTASKVQVQAASTADTPLGFDNVVHSGTAPTALQPWRCELIGPGAYGNGARLYVYDNKLKSGTRINMRLTLPAGEQEYFESLSKDPNDPRQWLNYFNTHSHLARIREVSDPSASPNDWPAVNETGIAFTGGDNGSCVLQDNDWAGDALAGTGFYAADRVPIPSLDIQPIGTTSAVAITALTTFLDARHGWVGEAATPDDLTPEQTKKWRMGEAPDYSHAAFDSPNLALIFDNVDVLDYRNNQRVRISALPHLAAAIARTDRSKDVSWSPFGVKRGSCPGALSVRHNASEGEADLLAAYHINRVREIETSVEWRGNEGIKLWGGWTTQLHASALSEFPVVRKCKMYERMLIPVCNTFINDPNHPTIWKEVARVLEPVFRRDLEREYIYGFVVVTDKDAFFAGGELIGATLNTPDDIDQGIYHCRMLIKPLRQIFYFCAELGVMRTGDPFATYSTMYQLPGWAQGIAA